MLHHAFKEKINTKHSGFPFFENRFYTLKPFSDAVKLSTDARLRRVLAKIKKQQVSLLSGFYSTKEDRYPFYSVTVY